MKTSVDYLIQELFNNGYFHYGIPDELVEQAKQMEKEQIIRAHILGIGIKGSISPVQTAEQYYNETYKNTNDV